MYPILLDLGKIQIHTYGFFAVLGFCMAVWFSKRNAAFYNISKDDINDIFFAAMVSGIVGARLLYVGLNFKEYRHNFLEIFKIWTGGLIFFGGLITAIGVVLIVLKIKKLPIWKTADIITPGLALGHSVARLGCFFAGCCYGKQCSLPFAIQFKNHYSMAPLNIPIHPTQLYMALSNFLLFLLLVWLQKRKKFHGMIFLLYIILYSSFRFVIEYFRGDFRGYFFFDFLSLSQGIGIVISIIALLTMIRLARTSNQ